ncbi:hypothetical protein PF050_14125 [Kosakonia pseudosacchari]|uniref:hypothetical protein n=1 Tax=Kosakonia pseudosacchari TaxID=1646340 RepID=UPI0022F01034|nr:hypothetical protein [Kosakonia pseudosacchari]WBU47628.1 hypothetical protein PF050_14125 [Kosakonia pseudosacchari]
MKKNYFIPGFEPEEIHDMAKSALKQIHERKVNPVKYDHDEPNRTARDMKYINLNEQYEVLYALNKANLNPAHAAGVSAGYNSFRQYHISTNVHPKHEVGWTIHKFDLQLDSADHGKNVVASTASISKKIAQ